MQPLTLDELATLDESLEMDLAGAPVQRETFQRLAALLAQMDGPPVPRHLALMLIDVATEELEREEP